MLKYGDSWSSRLQIMEWGNILSRSSQFKPPLALCPWGILLPSAKILLNLTFFSSPFFSLQFLFICLGPIDAAGIMHAPLALTTEGFESHLGINYLGHFVLTRLLLDILKRSGTMGQCSRIVNVSSAVHAMGTVSCIKQLYSRWDNTVCVISFALILFIWPIRNSSLLGSGQVSLLISRW